jgi:hypothetical protein
MPVTPATLEVEIEWSWFEASSGKVDGRHYLKRQFKKKKS